MKGRGVCPKRRKIEVAHRTLIMVKVDRGLGVRVFRDNVLCELPGPRSGTGPG